MGWSCIDRAVGIFEVSKRTTELNEPLSVFPGCNSLVPGSRGPPGFAPILNPCRRLEHWDHLCWTRHQEASVPWRLWDRPALQDLQVGAPEHTFMHLLKSLSVKRSVNQSYRKQRKYTFSQTGRMFAKSQPFIVLSSCFQRGSHSCSFEWCDAFKATHLRYVLLFHIWSGWVNVAYNMSETNQSFTMQPSPASLQQQQWGSGCSRRLLQMNPMIKTFVTLHHL